MKTVPVDMKNWSDVVSQEVVKNKKLNKLNIKVNNLENQIPDVSVLIQTNQYEADTIYLGKNWTCW